MSEQELRDFVAKVLDSPIGVTPKGWKAVTKALSEPPDVVMLLRWAYEQHSWAKVGTPTAYTVVRCETLWDVIKELEKTVRLTADGWEWVEK